MSTVTHALQYYGDSFPNADVVPWGDAMSRWVADLGYDQVIQNMRTAQERTGGDRGDRGARYFFGLCARMCERIETGRDDAFGVVKHVAAVVRDLAIDRDRERGLRRCAEDMLRMAVEVLADSEWRHFREAAKRLAEAYAEPGVLDLVDDARDGSSTHSLLGQFTRPNEVDEAEDLDAHLDTVILRGDT